MTFNRASVGLYELDFGFKVDDRFLSVSKPTCCLVVGAEAEPTVPTEAVVAAYNPYSASPTRQDSSFYIFVY